MPIDKEDFRKHTEEDKKNFEMIIEDGRKNEKALNIILNDISYIKNDVLEIKASLKNGYVSQQEFEPIKKVVYGMVGTILISIIGSVIALAIKV